MYTQCPECGTSFNVTAEVLKQAVGKVRCGDCGIAFNALEYLSEQKPESELIHDTDAQLPELKPGARTAESVGEMRFDDNTPLPDDFDAGDEQANVADTVGAGNEPAPADAVQVDLELGKPDEWEELLEEVDAPRAPPENAVPQAVDEALPDMDEQFAMKAEAMGIDISGVYQQVDDADAKDVSDTTIDEDLFAAAFEVEEAGADEGTDVEEIELREEEDDTEEHVILPSTDEDDTVNRMIDQDLMSQAKDDEDGMKSTIIEKFGELGELGDNPIVETIIMEGDETREEIEKRILAGRTNDEGADEGFVAQARKSMRGVLERSGLDETSGGYGTAVGILLFSLILAGQFLHQSRETLATIAVFGNTVGPVYRAIGRPVTPAWDITGWRFEVTKGSTDDSDELLTIYSRIGNQSDQALPYPLVSVSLTDRFEETIGSRVLEPAQYLAGEFDPRQPVPPGNTFNAVIAIESPSPDATGFQLNVCYRLTNGLLRCAIDDFK